MMARWMRWIGCAALLGCLTTTVQAEDSDDYAVPYAESYGPPPAAEKEQSVFGGVKRWFSKVSYAGQRERPQERVRLARTSRIKIYESDYESAGMENPDAETSRLAVLRKPVKALQGGAETVRDGTVKLKDAMAAQWSKLPFNRKSEVLSSSASREEGGETSASPSRPEPGADADLQTWRAHYENMSNLRSTISETRAQEAQRRDEEGVPDKIESSDAAARHRVTRLHLRRAEPDGRTALSMHGQLLYLNAKYRGFYEPGKGLKDTKLHYNLGATLDSGQWSWTWNLMLPIEAYQEKATRTTTPGNDIGRQEGELSFHYTEVRAYRTLHEYFAVGGGYLIDWKDWERRGYNLHEQGWDARGFNYEPRPPLDLIEKQRADQVTHGPFISVQGNYPIADTRFTLWGRADYAPLVLQKWHGHYRYYGSRHLNNPDFGDADSFTDQAYYIGAEVGVDFMVTEMSALTLSYRFSYEDRYGGSHGDYYWGQAIRRDGLAIGLTVQF